MLWRKKEKYRRKFRELHKKAIEHGSRQVGTHGWGGLKRIRTKTIKDAFGTRIFRRLKPTLR